MKITIKINDLIHDLTLECKVQLVVPSFDQCYNYVRTSFAREARRRMPTDTLMHDVDRIEKTHEGTVDNDGAKCG